MGGGGRPAAMRTAIGIAEAMALADDHHHHHLAGASESPQDRREAFRLGRVHSYTTQRDRDHEAFLARRAPGWGAGEEGGRREASRETSSIAGALSFSSGAVRDGRGRRGVSMRRRHGDDGAGVAIRRFDLGSEGDGEEEDADQAGSGVDMAVEDDEAA